MAMNIAAKDFSLEYASVSGILYVTVDRKLLCTKIFDEHVKLQVVFNKDVEGRHVAFDRYAFGKETVGGVEAQDVRLEQEPLPVVNVTNGFNFKVVDLMEDNAALSVSAVATDPDDATSNVDNDKIIEVEDELGVYDCKSAYRNKTKIKKVSQMLVSKKNDVQLAEDNPTLSAHAIDPENATTSDAGKISEVEEEHSVNEYDFNPANRKSPKKVSQMLMSKKKTNPRDSELPPRGTSANRMPKESTITKTGSLAVRERKERRSAVNSRLKTKEIICNMKTTTKSRIIYMIDREQDIYCQYCCKLFKSERQFISHNRIERKKHHCVRCKRVLYSKASLFLHLDDHEKEALGERVQNYEPRDKKYRRAHLLKPRKCPICGLVRSNFDSLKSHVKKIHTGEKEYKCCICGHLTRSHCLFVAHMRKQHIDDSFEQIACKACNITFASRKELLAHRWTHTFPCDLCGKDFPNRSGLNTHCQSFHKQDGFTCHICSKIYSSKQVLDSHIDYHNRHKKSKCPTCGMFYISLKKHIAQKHAPEGTTFVCDQCPKQFKTKKCLQTHKVVHSDMKRYECPECSKRFIRLSGLKNHIRIHSTEKLFVCDICGKACKVMGNLTLHMKVHQRSGANPVPSAITVYSGSQQYSWFPSFNPPSDPPLGTLSEYSDTPS